MIRFKLLSQVISVCVVVVQINLVFAESPKDIPKKLTLSELLSTIASSTEKTAKFTETRTADFLAIPLTSNGILEFIAPATLIKKIQSPDNMQQRIVGDVMTLITEPLNDSGDVEQFDNNQTVSLSSYPELEIGINAIRWVLSGNVAALNESFQVVYTHTKENWQLTLNPKDVDLLISIQNIIIKGKAKHIIQIKIIQNKSESITTDLYEHH